MKNFIVTVGFIILGVYIAGNLILADDPSSGSIKANATKVAEKMQQDIISGTGR